MALGSLDEGRQVVSVFADLLVAEAERRRSQGQKAVMVADEISTGLPRMSAMDVRSRRGWVIKTCGSFLEDRHHRAHRHAADHVERDEAVGAHAEIGRAARQQLRHIHIRSALE